MEDEISLIEIWQIISARKWFIFAAPVVTTLLAVVYLVVTKPEFECKAYILVGQIGKEHLIQDTYFIENQLRQKFGLDDKTSPRSFPRLVDISNSKNNNIIALTAIDHTADGAKTFLINVAEDILTANRIFEDGRQIMQERLRSLNDQIETFKTYQRQLDQSIESVVLKDSAQAAILAVEKGKFLATNTNLEAQLFQLRIEMSELESFPTRLIWEPQSTENPVKPKKTLVLFLAGLSGLMLGVIATILIEFIARVHQQLKEKTR